MIDKNNYIGLSGFVWWVGEIEDIYDPLYLRRCKVRIFGWHNDNTSELPTQDLPWCQTLSAFNVSKTWIAPSIGDWVVGFFMDGENAQYPVALGVLPGLKQTDKP